MSDFKTRLHEEITALGDKLGKLNIFLQGEQIKELPAEQQDLLKKQAVHMQDYFNVLNQRLALLEKDAAVSSTFGNDKANDSVVDPSASNRTSEGPGNQSQSAGLSDQSQSGDQPIKD